MQVTFQLRVLQRISHGLIHTGTAAIDLIKIGFLIQDILKNFLGRNIIIGWSDECRWQVILLYGHVRCCCGLWTLFMMSHLVVTYLICQLRIDFEQNWGYNSTQSIIAFALT